MVKNGPEWDEKRLLAEFLSIRKVLNRERFLTGLNGEGGAFSHLSAEDYYRILDTTGRLLRREKRGVIGADVRPLLESLNLDAAEWLETVRKYRKRFGLVAGTRDVMLSAARKAGQRWWKGIRGADVVFLDEGCLMGDS